MQPTSPKIRKNQGHTSRGVKFLIDADTAVHCCCWQLSEVDSKLQQRHHLANNYKDVVYETIIWTAITEWICMWTKRKIKRHEAAIRKSSPDWRRPVGRPRHTWYRTVESHLRPLNTDLSSANWDAWRSVVDTAMLKMSLPWKRKVTLSSTPSLVKKNHED